MSKLKDCQRKAISSNKKVVFCNWKRVSGKSETIAREIYGMSLGTRENKNILVITSFSESNECKVIYDFIRQMFIEEKVDIKISKNNIQIIDQRKIAVTIKFINVNNFHFAKGETVDKVYCDEFIPTKSQLECILGFAKQVKIFTTYIDNEYFEYISDVEDKIDKNEWISYQIDELMKEYSSISKDDNTTMRREKVLLQIKMLKELFE